jgi:hypothetical protein
MKVKKSLSFRRRYRKGRQSLTEKVNLGGNYGSKSNKQRAIQKLLVRA